MYKAGLVMTTMMMTTSTLRAGWPRAATHGGPAAALPSDVEARWTHQHGAWPIAAPMHVGCYHVYRVSYMQVLCQALGRKATVPAPRVTGRRELAPHFRKLFRVLI